MYRNLTSITFLPVIAFPLNLISAFTSGKISHDRYLYSDMFVKELLVLHLY